MSQAPLLTMTADSAQSVDAPKTKSTTNDFDVPKDVQTHLDLIIDYYAEKALKPHVQLCGDPLHISSSLVTQIQKTLPETLATSGKIVLDFLIGQICSFCRNNNAGRITFSFEFKR